jgi:hypothetical protein
VFVFVSFFDETPQPYGERLAPFKAENCVGPNDAVQEVTVTFA